MVTGFYMSGAFHRHKIVRKLHLVLLGFCWMGFLTSHSVAQSAPPPPPSTIGVPIENRGTEFSVRRNHKLKIQRISPNSASYHDASAIKVTLYGRGFSGTGLSVMLNGRALTNVRIISDKKLRVEIPREVSSGGEVPPMVLQAGRYALTVSNRSGSSNSVNFTLSN